VWLRTTTMKLFEYSKLKNARLMFTDSVIKTKSNYILMKSTESLNRLKFWHFVVNRCVSAIHQVAIRLIKMQWSPLKFQLLGTYRFLWLEKKEKQRFFKYYYFNRQQYWCLYGFPIKNLILISYSKSRVLDLSRSMSLSYYYMISCPPLTTMKLKYQ